MIIIKNMILYFILIRHTDDFPSTGTRLVQVKMTTHTRIMTLTYAMKSHMDT